VNSLEILSTNLSSLADQVNSVLGKKTIFIIGSCSAIFDGRIKSELKTGHRFLFVKSDTSIILHGNTSVKPLNWQKAYDGKIEFSYSEKTGVLEMYTFRPKTQEVFKIFFNSVVHAISYDASDASKLEVEGDERDLVNYLVSNPDVIETGISIVSREKETLVGFIDIEAIDSKGKTLIIEVKKQKATPADAFQLLRYIETLEKQQQIRYRGMLISAGTPSKVKEFLIQNNLEFLDVHWQEIFPALKRSKSKSLSDFIN
jgi:hypothetical protein